MPNRAWTGSARIPAKAAKVAPSAIKLVTTATVNQAGVSGVTRLFQAPPSRAPSEKFAIAAVPTISFFKPCGR